jgi:DNA-binding IclR family transcriptional regulator
MRPMRKKTRGAAAAGGVAAVDRCLAILAAFDGARPALGLGELALRTGLYKSTILRLLASLERRAFVQRGTDGRYRIGPGAWRVGLLFLRALDVEERLRPVVQDLAARADESASLYVPLPGSEPPARVCLLRADAAHSVRDHVRVGDQLPLSEGAAGRVLRAFLEPSSPELSALRRDRVHASWGERDPEIAGVAAPVFGGDGWLVGALTLSAPTARRSRSWLEGMKPVVLAAAERASRELGFAGEARR